MLVESAGSWPEMTSSASAASSTVVANGPIWSRLDPNAISPRRLTAPYVGLTPTTPHSAAGCRIEPPVSEPRLSGANPAATAAADPPDDPPGTRRVSSGFRVGPEGGVLGARPHRELVEVRLADHDRSGLAQAGDDGGVVRRLPVAEDLRRTRRRDAAGAHVVLQRDRDAGQRARIGPDRRHLVDRCGLLTRLVGEHQVEGVDLVVACLDRREVSLDDGRCGRRPEPYCFGDRGRRCGLAHRQSSSPMIGGTRNRWSSASGAAAEHLVAVEAVPHHVVAHHVGEMGRIVHRLDAVEVECIDLGEVVEHRTEFDRRGGEFVIGEREAGQGGHLAHVRGRDSIRHGGHANCESRRGLAREEPARSGTMAGMTPRETLTTIAGPTGDIGAAFFFHPATVEAGREFGLGGFVFYILGRGGALGDVPPAVVSAAFGYFNPETIASTWNKYRLVVSPPVVAQAYWDECAKRGNELFADVDGLEAYIEAADIVIDHADLAGLPLFAGVAQLLCSDDVPGRAMQKAAVLRELRGSVHLISVLASGLSDAQAHAIKRPGDVAMFGWEEAPEVPVDGDIKMDAAEELTNTILERAFFALTSDQAAALVAGTRAMHAALTPQS